MGRPFGQKATIEAVSSEYIETVEIEMFALAETLAPGQSKYIFYYPPESEVWSVKAMQILLEVEPLATSGTWKLNVYSGVIGSHTAVYSYDKNLYFDYGAFIGTPLSCYPISEECQLAMMHSLICDQTRPLKLYIRNDLDVDINGKKDAKITFHCKKTL